MFARKSLIVAALFAIMLSVPILGQTSSVLQSGYDTKFEAELLFFDDTFEPNNSQDQATSVNFGGGDYWATSYDTDEDSNQPTHAAISPNTDTDWYKLEAKAGERLQIEMRILAPKQMDGVMSFYFGTSLIYPINSYGKGLSENIDFPVPPNSGGTYYIEVASYANQQEGRYRLLIYRTLIPEPNTLSLVYPNDSGIILVSGQTYEIKWNKSGPDPIVKIELYKGGAWCQNIKNNAENTGSYFWQVPATTATGSDYKIKITSVSNPSVTDMSDNNFTTPVIAKENGPVAPKLFALSQNFPNPFNPTTTFCYILPRSGQVKLTVYNLLGYEVAKLVDARQEDGEHHIVWSPENLPGGTYFLRLEAENKILTRKIILLR